MIEEKQDENDARRNSCFGVWGGVCGKLPPCPSLKMTLRGQKGDITSFCNANQAGLGRFMGDIQTLVYLLP